MQYEFTPEDRECQRRHGMTDKELAEYKASIVQWVLAEERFNALSTTTAQGVN